MKTSQEILVECWYDKTDIESIIKWADETWTNSSAPHLKQDLENQLPYIAEWINNNN